MNHNQLRGIDENIKLGLERVKKGARVLKIPINDFRAVLIAGTNGKGTTAVFLSKILQEHGKNTVVYISPHLESPTERVLVKGRPVNERELLEALERVRNTNRKEGLSLTPFEEFTLASLIIAQKEKPWMLIYEVGLGGRLDATNILNNEVSIITSIGIDHTEFLGVGLKEIAREKAGIIKPSSVVITGALPASAEAVVEAEAKRKGASLYRLKKEVGFSFAREKGTVEFSVKGVDFTMRVNTPFLHMAQNAALSVFAASKILGSLNPDATRRAVERVPLPARCEVVKLGEKTAVIDTAHNPHALSILLKEVSAAFEEPLTVVLSPLRDKDWRRMAKLASARGRLLMVEQPTKRGLKRSEAPEFLWIDTREITEVVERCTGTVVFAGSFWMAKTARRLLCQR